MSSSIFDSDFIRTKIRDVVEALLKIWDDDNIQYQIPGWGQCIGERPDIWTSAEVLFSLNTILNETFLDDLRERIIQIAKRTLKWISLQQLPEGAFTAPVYRGQPSVSVSAWAVIALSIDKKEYIGNIEKAIAWLSSVQLLNGSWLDEFKYSVRDIPELTSSDFYSVAYTVKALCLCARKTDISERLQKAVSFLMTEQDKNGGWPPAKGLETDPTYVGYVLDGMLDAVAYGVNVDMVRLALAIEWLKDSQQEGGHWHDWQGVRCSIEATSYAIYVLLRAGENPNSEVLLHAFQFLIYKFDSKNHGWAQDPEKDEPVNIWVTANGLWALSSVMEALTGGTRLIEKSVVKKMELGQYKLRTTHPKLVGLKSEHAELQATLRLSRIELNVGECIDLEIDVANAGKGPAVLDKIEGAIPEGFETVEKPETLLIEQGNLDMRRIRLDPLKTKRIKLVLKPWHQGTFHINPRILYVDEEGRNRSSEPGPVAVKVKELGIRRWIKGER